MKKNLTEIVFILDRSGSMAGLEDDTIGGFNAMIEKQKREAGEALVSTVLFDNDCEVIHDRVDIQRIGPMTRKEYDVRGCAAVCRVVNGFQRLIEDDVAGKVVWTAAAKPFGCVEGLDGEIAPVTAFKNFVTPALTDVRLVPVDSVGGRDLSTADPVWSEHVRSHLPEYLVSGPGAGSGCLYCHALREWERESLRSQARRWLEFNSGSCIRTSGPGGEWGGTPHGH